MSKRTKDVSAIKDDAGLKAKLQEITTDEIATSLVGVCAKARADFTERLSKAFKDTLDYSIDACAEIAKDDHTGASLDAADYAMSVVEANVMCRLLTLAAHVAATTHTSCTRYAAHAIEHYETAAAAQLERERKEILSNLLEIAAGPGPSNPARVN
jgi:ATP-dependent protease HslVU (ClpYQ) peptidase subunit